MKRQTGGFNKEKLVFLLIAGVLAFCVYSMLVSAPAELIVTPSVSTLPPPGPLDREKPDTRVKDVRYYLDDGRITGMRDVMTNAIVDRSRLNPFEPLRDAKNLVNVKDPKETKPPVAVQDLLPPPPPPVVPEPVQKKEPLTFGPHDAKAEVDFNAVMTMNGETYALLKTKSSGTTLQVRVGDYIDEYKYTVSRIEPQAIWVTDDENRTFVARDSSIDAPASTGAEPAAAPKRAKAVQKPAPVMNVPKQQPANPAAANPLAAPHKQNPANPNAQIQGAHQKHQKGGMAN